MRLPQRHSIVHGVLVVFAAALVAKAAQVQIAQHARWEEAANRQHTVEATLVAPRGEIQDATGYPLAQTRELVRLAFALDVIRDRRSLHRSLLALGVPPHRARPVLDRTRRWYELRQNFLASQVAALMKLKGVRMYPSGEREYVQSEGTRRLLGHVNGDGQGVDGIELFLDSLLTGTPGVARTLRTGSGTRFDSPDLLTDPPRRGHTVRLAINQGLQDICDQALVEATRRLAADGGDIVILDPHSGALRCLASHRRGVRGGSPPTLLEPFEPGSTLKPFLVGHLLQRQLARADEVIETYNGEYVVHGRRITDVHREPRMSVAAIIQHSSNVGIARLSERLSDGDLFMLYRDLGFGTPTGLPFPSEAAGILYEPRRWSRQSHASLAIGYEVAVTPLQLALAYAAIANGGWLVSPGLVAEIRDDEGRVLYTHHPRAIRRVFDESTTRAVMAMLESVVDSGTARDARLARYAIAGKSGTARRVIAGRYRQGGATTYTSSFVALFPADRPQYVVLVKLDNPREAYYGGQTAAPVARSVILAALAARDASLDWGALPPPRPPRAPMESASSGVATTPSPDVASEPGPAVATDADAPPLPAVALIDSTPEPVLRGPVRFELAHPPAAETLTRPLALVPDVRGLPLRVAVRELHRAGFRVQLTGAAAGTTVPAAGSEVRTGTLVRLGRS